MDSYLDAGKPTEDRVQQLLECITLDEKIAQLGAVWAMELLDGRSFSS
jgi:beta-glucosidase